MHTQTGRTHRAKTVAFFYEHAGYSHDPKTETAEEGRKRCARALADAEAQALANNWHYKWVDDWSVGDHTKEYDTYDSQPNTCEGCILYDEHDNVLASLWCIDDATADYRRVVEAELAEQAL